MVGLQESFEQFKGQNMRVDVSGASSLKGKMNYPTP